MPYFFAFLNKYSVEKALKTRFLHPLGAVLGGSFAFFFIFKASTILIEILRIEIARANLLARAFLLSFKLVIMFMQAIGFAPSMYHVSL